MGETFSEEQLQQMMQQLDCFKWVVDNKLELSNGSWELTGHEYQAAWLQEDAREQCFIKGAQIGATEALVLRTLHGMIMGTYRSGALYLFPTRDDVKDFSKARFDPLIDQNPFIGIHVQNTDSTNIKQIGRGFLYLRGARATKHLSDTKKSSSQLKGIPVDRVVFDELDEMDEQMVRLAKERVSHSKIKELMYLGTPTVPNYGIDSFYQKSDQRVWMIRCDKCNKASSLDQEFPKSLIRRTDGTVYRACVHCKAEVHPANGFWDAQYPDRDLVGWWISQLNSIYIDPTDILDEYEDPPRGDLSEVMNSKLGRAYIPAENRLTESDVYACCRQDPMLTRHDGPTCMGVDVGRDLHVVIAERKNRECLKVVWMGRVESFNDLHDLVGRFSVRSCVIDLRPEIRKVREFQRTESISVFGCEYIELKAGLTTWDEKEKLVKCNRTEICDATHEIVVEPGRLELPRVTEEVKEFAYEMCNIVKMLDEDPVSGSRTYRYKKLGSTRPDHYRHALNYCLLASERCGIISDRNLINRFFGERRRRTWMTV